MHDHRRRPSTREIQPESVGRLVPVATANEQRPPSGRRLAARGRNQLVLRQVNEQIADLTESNETGVSLFICECIDQECAEALELSATEYERIRSEEANFVVFPGHEQPALERVVERHGRFVVVASAVGGSSHPESPAR